MEALWSRYNTWAEQSIVDEVIIIAVIIAVVEAVAQNFLKTSDDNNRVKFLFGLSFYVIVGFLLHHAYHKFDLSKVNVTWSCLSIILATTLGYFLYQENLSWKNIVSVVLALLAIIFASM